MKSQKEAFSTPLSEYPGRPYRIASDTMNDAQKAIVTRVVAGPRGAVPINLQIWLNNPGFAEVAERFGCYVSQEAPMTPRAKEIVILVVSAQMDSDFEWYWHSRLARTHGLTEEQITAIREKRDPDFSDPLEAVTHALAYGLSERRDVPDALHARAMQLLGHSGISDVIGLMGLYTMIAHTINVYRVPLPTPTAL
ncbi:MAG: carboxymuconolactone decarboxylase family protein [Pseudomonadota bacterium]|nr:carboxymuconolactone decarboxylase family protein [Pseudomonadota bacterium]